jgi:hypothetical protein
MTVCVCAKCVCVWTFVCALITTEKRASNALAKSQLGNQRMGSVHAFLPRVFTPIPICLEK